MFLKDAEVKSYEAAKKKLQNDTYCVVTLAVSNPSFPSSFSLDGDKAEHNLE